MKGTNFCLFSEGIHVLRIEGFLYHPSPPEVCSQTIKKEKSEVVEDFKKLHVNKSWCVFEWLALVRYA